MYLFINTSYKNVMQDLFRVGIISSMHGVKGEVKVYPTTDDINRFKNMKKIIMDTGKEKLTFEIEGVKYFKGQVILKFFGYNNRNEVEVFKGKNLFVERENAIPLKEGEFYIDDIISFEVITDLGEKIGELADVMQTGANDVYVVKKKDDKELLLPCIKECILNIDIEKRQITVHMMKGLE